jgi:DNA-binding NtrC family response regulator
LPEKFHRDHSGLAGSGDGQPNRQQQEGERQRQSRFRSISPIACVPEIVGSFDGLALLRAYAWPGNVRELRNTLERACLASHELTLSLDTLRKVLPVSVAEPMVPTWPNSADEPLAARLAALERETIQHALARAGGKKAAAARMLGISRSQLYDKLRMLNLSD